VPIFLKLSKLEPKDFEKLLKLDDNWKVTEVIFEGEQVYIDGEVYEGCWDM